MRVLKIRFSDAAERETVPGIDWKYEDGVFRCKLWYDFSSEPLILSGEAAPDGTAVLRFRPWRVELWLDGVLADEEWPCGKPVFDLDAMGAETQEDAEPVPPAVTGTLQKAAGWRPGGGVFVGDCMPYVTDGRYHVLYLKDRRHHHSKWGLGAHQWCHISTKDFVSWQEHPMAVPITDPMEGSICTGSWIGNGNRQYFYYTVRMADRSPAPICRSVSEDGYHFEKDRRFSLTLSDRFDGVSARDPKVIRDEEGLYHMLVTTSLTAEKRGCLAHLISDDLDAWRETDDIPYRSADEWQPECPDYFFYQGWYYLIFSLKGQAHYRYSRKPFGAWNTPENDIIPCHSVPKAGSWDGKLVFTGFVPTDGGKYAGTMTFRKASAGQDGILIFET